MTPQDLSIRRRRGFVYPAIIEAVPFKINGVRCRLIPLSRGLWAIVWEIHYGFLMQWKWTAMKGTRGGFYARRSIAKPDGRRKMISMQNVLMPPESGFEIDHISGCGLDNRWDNFRQATRRQQCQNKARRSNSSNIYRGVKWDGSSFWARVQGVYKGPFRTELEAAVAHDELAIKAYGEFARLNFPDGVNSSACSSVES